MKYIVEYKMWGTEKPYFIEDGGYYPHEEKLFGLTRDSNCCYVPKLMSQGGELVDVDRTQMKTILDTLNLKDMQGNDENTQNLVDSFFSERGL